MAFSSRLTSTRRKRFFISQNLKRRRRGGKLQGYPLLFGKEIQLTETIENDAIKLNRCPVEDELAAFIAVDIQNVVHHSGQWWQVASASSMTFF